MLVKESFRWLLDSLSTGVLLLDEDLRISYLNPAASALLATGSKSLGQPLETVFLDHDVTGMRAALQRALVQGHPFNKREAHVWMGGGEAVVDYAVTPVHPESYSMHLLMELQPMDRLIRIAREEALLANHHATRQLVRGVAHEIKNPLGGIRGAAQLLAKALPNEDLHDYTNIIIEETDRLRHLADRMLGPRTLPKMQQVNIHECLERVRHLILAEAKGDVEIMRDYDPSLPELHADPDQLIQVLLNITGNALQALRENPDPQREGRILFRTRPQRQYTIGSIRHRLVLQVDIEDNGPGIPPDLVDNIFYPMISGRPSGTGLGLSIAQDIVNQYQGLIECQSIPGQTVFTVFLPASGGAS